MIAILQIYRTHDKIVYKIQKFTKTKNKQKSESHYFRKTVKQEETRKGHQNSMGKKIQ